MSRPAQPSRRDFFSRIADGLHGTALATLLGADLLGSAGRCTPSRSVYDLTPKPPHFEPKAKAVIHLFMNGGPSQVDLFDPKPALEKYAGTIPRRDLTTDVSSPKQLGGLLPAPYKFKKYGQSGMDVSEVMPHFTKHVDDVALIRSMYGEHFNHEPALFLMHTGRTIATPPVDRRVGRLRARAPRTRICPAYVGARRPQGPAHQRHLELAVRLPAPAP